MIAPATTVGALVLHTAEVLSGLTIAQTAFAQARRSCSAAPRRAFTCAR